MAVYRRSTVVDAPLSAVWDFHSTIDGLRALTPGFLSLRVEEVSGPDGEPDPAVLDAGTRIGLSMRPLGVGPRRTWTSVITDREAGDDGASFRDVMEDGPFATWIHTHRFDAVDGRTRISDRVEYEFADPLGPLSALGWPGFEAMFAYRHHRTRSLLE